MQFPGDLFAELDAMRRLLGAGEWPSSIRASARGAFPALNMGTTEGSVEIYAFAPGLNPAKIDVTVEKGVLAISGERESGVPSDEGTHFYARERFTGSFKRVVSLPEEVDSSRIEATYRNGVLRITVPRLARAQPRRIEVQGAEKLEHRK
jgi:HSP20 family protein